MSIDLVKRLATFVVLVLVQGLVFNHIHLFNCATPLLYIIKHHNSTAHLGWGFVWTYLPIRQVLQQLR